MPEVGISNDPIPEGSSKNNVPIFKIEDVPKPVEISNSHMPSDSVAPNFNNSVPKVDQGKIEDDIRVPQDNKKGSGDSSVDEDYDRFEDDDDEIKDRYF